MADDRAGEQWLSSTEAAARLGVKLDTLYAYVSRGLLDRRVAPDGRSSLFGRREVESLRARRGRRAVEGLATIVASAITRVGDDGLSYRGTRVEDLVAAGVDYEEVAALLLGVESSGARWEAEPRVLAATRRAGKALPEHAPAIDRIRMALTIVSAHDPLRHDISPAAVHIAMARLVATIVESLPGDGDGDGEGGGDSTARQRVVDRLWPRLTRQRATPGALSALNVALVALADHDLAASTYAARIAASTRADPYAVVAAGLGVLGGPLHGAASSECHELISRATAAGSATAAVGELLAMGRRVPGFGHKVYERADPRYQLLIDATRTAYPDDERWPLIDELVHIGIERSGRIPNVDLGLAGLTVMAGMPAGAGEVVFAVARIAGWLAHALEEYGEPALRYRPQSRYVGPAPAPSLGR